MLRASRLTPEQKQELLVRLGIGGLPAPTFAGYALHTDGTWTVATLYGSHAGAIRAATIIGRVLREGTSPVLLVPYSKVLRTTSVKADRDAVVVTLARSARVPQMVVNGDVPSFFSLPVGG